MKIKLKIAKHSRAIHHFQLGGEKKSYIILLTKIKIATEKSLMISDLTELLTTI